MAHKASVSELLWFAHTFGTGNYQLVCAPVPESARLTYAAAQMAKCQGLATSNWNTRSSPWSTSLRYIFCILYYDGTIKYPEHKLEEQSIGGPRSQHSADHL